MDVRESFRGPFVETARRRCRRVAELVEERGAAELRSAASELHTLSGEAGMLDFGRVADVARVAEEAARAGDHERVRALLRELLAAIMGVEQGA